MVCNVEGCERTAVCKGQCNPCYQRAYYAAKRHEWQPGGRYWDGIQERSKARRKPEREPTVQPCTYLAAHKRVHHRRGRAAEHTCPCGQPAEQWSYRGDSPREQEGWHTITGRKRRDVWVRWSPDPADYDALCVRCHSERDGRLYHG